MTVAEFRENAVREFFEELEACGFPEDEGEVRVILEGIADQAVPITYQQIYELAGDNFSLFFSAPVESFWFGREISADKLLQIAMEQWLEGELEREYSTWKEKQDGE